MEATKENDLAKYLAILTCVITVGVGFLGACAAAVFYLGEPGAWEQEVADDLVGFFLARWLFTVTPLLMALLLSWLVAWLANKLGARLAWVTGRYFLTGVSIAILLSLTLTLIAFLY